MGFNSGFKGLIFTDVLMDCVAFAKSGTIYQYARRNITEVSNLQVQLFLFSIIPGRFDF